MNEDVLQYSTLQKVSADLMAAATASATVSPIIVLIDR